MKTFCFYQLCVKDLHSVNYTYLYLKYLQNSGSACPVNTKWKTEKNREGNRTETVLKNKCLDFSKIHTEVFFAIIVFVQLVLAFKQIYLFMDME